jgi:hypothetical protein
LLLTLAHEPVKGALLLHNLSLVLLISLLGANLWPLWTNVHKTRTLEASGLLEPGESAKLTGAVGSSDLAGTLVESAKLTT